MANLTGWLIENADRHPVPKWLASDVNIRWTTDANKALRYATEDEARDIIRLGGSALHGRCWPTEHIFMDSTDSGEVKS
jgi:hypothetical protein